MRIVSEVKAAFYDLYALHKGIEILQKERSLLEQLAKIASARYAVGKGIQQDVLDAEPLIRRIDESLGLELVVLGIRQGREFQGFSDRLLDITEGHVVGA